MKNEDKLNKVTDELLEVSQDTTLKSQILKNTSLLMSQTIELQNNIAINSAKNANTIGKHLNTSVNSVDVAFEDVSTILKQLIEKVSSLNEAVEAVRKIESVVNRIEEIATQSKMLALNATIEAARFGEQGKGFAVVATEVKSLATATEKFSVEIINAINDVTDILTLKIEENIQVASSGSLKIDNTQNAIVKLKEVYGYDGDCADETTICGLIKGFEALSRESQSVLEQSQNLEVVSDELGNQVMKTNGLISDLIGIVKDSPIVNLSPEQSFEKLNDFKVIDVRGTDEFTGELSHIEGARLITINEHFFDNIKKLDKSKKYLFVCKLGGRSSRACREAQRAGIKNIFNLDGGMVAWNEKGLPVVEIKKAA